MMSFGDAVNSVFCKYQSFSGRATRSEYWWWILFQGLLLIAASGLDYAIYALYGVSGNFIFILMNVFVFIPNITVAVRRTHDSGHSGWWIICPIYNFILMFLPSDPNKNKYEEIEEPANIAE